jgi:hypothetical protein
MFVCRRRDSSWFNLGDGEIKLTACFFRIKRAASSGRIVCNLQAWLWKHTFMFRKIPGIDQCSFSLFVAKLCSLSGGIAGCINAARVHRGPIPAIISERIKPWTLWWSQTTIEYDSPIWKTVEECSFWVFVGFLFSDALHLEFLFVLWLPETLKE